MCFDVILTDDDMLISNLTLSPPIGQSNNSVNHLPGTAVMETLYSSYRSVYPRIIYVLSVLRFFPTSNAIVERCFSTMLQVKSDWRNKLGAKSLEHLLQIKCAGPECGSNEVQRLLASSVDRYFRAKCRRPSSRPYGPRTKKVKVAVGEIDGVAADSEPTNTAECDSDTDTEN